jgi:predicted acyltransferase
MSVTVSPYPTISETTVKAPRVVSIDIFRGLTMAVMIFVNALSGVNGLPWWTYHAHDSMNAMTYVDMVFPFFLFIVGMSLPLSITQRLRRNPSQPALWAHVVVRSLGLVVLGLILANAEFCDPARMPMNGYLWALLALLSAALYLNVYEKPKRFLQSPRILRAVGLIGVVVMFACFRRSTPSGHGAWIDFAYPEILGLIGLTYLGAAILVILTRRWRWAPAGWFVLMTAINILSKARIATVFDRLSLYIWPFGDGAMVSVVMAGVLTSSIYLGIEPKYSVKRAMSIAAGFALIALASGTVLIPLGISKNRGTPTWCLYSIGASVLSFTLLYWLCDVKKWTRWAFFVRSAGANTLTTYLLPDFWIILLGVLGVTFYDTHFSYGGSGVMKTFAFTFLMLGISWAVTKAKVRLQF